MAKKHKTYPLNQSPLYKLKSKGKLFGLIGVSQNKLNSLLNRNDNYREFSKADAKSGKLRHYEVPKKRLEVIHRRLFILLSRILPPDYLHSGTKGRSHISNAKTHIGCIELMSLDIRDFYPSTRGWHVYDFFHNILLCSPDVSAILKDLVTYNDHVPTGSCLSQKIAFFAHYEMFNKIEGLSKQLNLTFSCFVDDLNLSGEFVSKYNLNQVRVILKNRGLQSHPKKERIYKTNRYKEVTGSIVTRNGLLLPNKKHKDIYDLVQQVAEIEDSELKLQKLISLSGKVVAAIQADHRVTKRLKTLRDEVNRVKKEIILSDKVSQAI